jgi:hypothetical protein
MFCWACDKRFTDARRCPECLAPVWARDVRRGGVYVIEAECGLVKIGYSNNFDKRFTQLVKDSHEWLELRTTFPGAGRDIEAWLHGVFNEVRDPKMARAFGLPNVSEWFWWTPALRRLASDDVFMLDGKVWEEALV